MGVGYGIGDAKPESQYAGYFWPYNDSAQYCLQEDECVKRIDILSDGEKIKKIIIVTNKSIVFVGGDAGEDKKTSRTFIEIPEGEQFIGLITTGPSNDMLFKNYINALNIYTLKEENTSNTITRDIKSVA